MKTGLKMAFLAVVLALVVGVGITPAASASGPYQPGWGYYPCYPAYGWVGYQPVHPWPGYAWWSGYGYAAHPVVYTGWTGYSYWGAYRYW